MGDVSARTRMRLIRAAEMLMARDGIGAVGTRDILELAAQRNRSALQYHFGSKEGLIRAALIEQMRRVDGRRAALVAKARPGDTEAVMRAFILPLAEDVANWEGGHDHLSLLSQFVHSPCHDFEALIKETGLPGISGAQSRMWETLSLLNPQTRVLRYRTTFSASLAALLSWSEGGVSSAPEDFTEELIGVVSPMMSGPAGQDGAICWRKNTRSGGGCAGDVSHRPKILSLPGQ